MRITILSDASVLQPSIFMSPTGGLRISIPSTRASSREVTNPIATDSLQLYADQMGCSFSPAPPINQYDYETLQPQRHEHTLLVMNQDSDRVNGYPLQPQTDACLPSRRKSNSSSCSQDIQLNKPVSISSSYTTDGVTQLSSPHDRNPKVRSEHPVIRLKFLGHELSQDALESGSDPMTTKEGPDSRTSTVKNVETGKWSQSSSTVTMVSHRRVSAPQSFYSTVKPSVETANPTSAEAVAHGVAQLRFTTSSLKSHQTPVPSTLPSSTTGVVVTSGGSSCHHLATSSTALSTCEYCKALWTWNSNFQRESVSPDSMLYRPPEEDDESSEGLPCIHTYQFSTLDQQHLSWMNIRVKQVREEEHRRASDQTSSRISSLGKESEETLQFNLFQEHMPSFQMCFKDDSLWGTLPIYINLIKPIKISLRKAGISLAQLEGLTLSQSMVADLLDNLAMFVPRGTCKMVRLRRETTARETILALLEHLYMKDPCHRFAIYEHSLEDENTIAVRKLHPDMSVLSHVLTWAHEDPEVMRTQVAKRRLVLQENESSDVKWTDFTLPELHNFLRILDKEQRQYEQGLRLHYGLRRQHIAELMEQNAVRLHRSS